MKVANYNFKIDLNKVILWQYNDATKLKSIVSNQQSFMDTNLTDFIRGWERNVFRLDDCDSFGLTVWGRLLNAPRPVYTINNEKHVFNDEQYRLLLKAKIYLLNFNGTCSNLNEFLKKFFPNVQFSVVDNYNMTVTIQVLSEMSDDLKPVLIYDGFLPRPSGVEYLFDFGTDYTTIFGFEGSEYQGTSLQGFDNGTFYRG